MNEQNKKVPTVRFKGFTNDWEQRKLGEIAKVTKLAGFEFTKYVNYSSKGKILAIRGLNIKDGKFNLQDVKYIDNSDFNKLTRSKLQQNDILFTYVGTIGNSAIVPAGVKWYLAPNVCLIRTQTENAKFISQLIQSDKFQHQEIPKWITTSSQPALSMENIRKFSIILPAVNEQLKIGNLISIIDTIITLQQRKLDFLKQLKKGLLQKMFADKGSKRPILRFEGFSNDWEQRKLKDIKDVRDGTHSSPKYQEEGYPLITSKNLATNGIDLSDVSFISKHDYQEINKRSKVENGDILFGMIGTIGNPVIVKKDGFAIKNVALIKYGGELLNYFLLYLLKSPIFLQYINRENVGGTQKFLALSVIRNFKFRVPSKAEQENIAHVLNSLTRLITLQQRKITKYNEIKKSLLQQMFI